MKNNSFFGAVLVCIAFISVVAPLASADTLMKTDFEKESFAKTDVDYFDYVRAYATLHGIPTGGYEKWHANMYMTYINNSGLKLLYAGLEDITTDESTYLRIPMQSFIMHYKTNENNRDVILASTFLMLMAFNETSAGRPDSPDRNDILYASFSLGFDLSDLGKTLPVLNSKTETIPLEPTAENQWTWGMRYSNLTALWWQTWIDPNNPRFQNSWPVALTVYDELTFTYKLTISPSTGIATLEENHVIGRMRHLFVGLIPLLWVYYNSTGNYGMLGRKLSDVTIYDYIQKNNLKMSIVNFQTSIMADHETYSTTPDGQNVEDSEIAVSDTSIDTYADDGEKIFSTKFQTKPTYNLYNFTDDQTETEYDTYYANATTAKIVGFAGNAGLFSLHMGLMKFLPLVVVHMYPALFAKATSTISDLSRANFFYTIAYPEYSGYRIEHDPTFTAYIASPATNPSLPSAGGLLVLASVIVAIGIVIVVLIALRKKRQ
jgi:hypothetical protein